VSRKKIMVMKGDNRVCNNEFGKRCILVVVVSPFPLALALPLLDVFPLCLFIQDLADSAAI